MAGEGGADRPVPVPRRRRALMEELWQKLQPQAVLYSGRLAGAVLILLLGWLVLRYLVGPLRRLLGRSRLDPSVASFLANSARTIILVVVILAVLQQLG